MNAAFGITFVFCKSQIVTLFAMNYFQNPNQLTHFWASVNEEFDKILNTFVRHKGWLFQDLGIIAKKADINQIYRCACATSNRAAHGKVERIDHFTRVIMIILDAAKIQWLAPWKTFMEPTDGKIPPFLKRQVGGFFLLYMMYLSQPLPVRFHRKQRIIMDSRDILAMHIFNATMQSLPKSNDELKELGKQLVILFNDLVMSEAFEFSVFNDVFVTPTTSIRRLLDTKNCSFTGIIYSLKDVRDQLHYITHQESLKVFQALTAYGKYLRKPPKKEKPDSKSKSTRSADFTGTETTSDFPPANKQWTVEEIKELENETDVGKIAHCLPSILKSLDIGPVLTRERFTGYDDKTLDREMSKYLESYNVHQRPIFYAREKKAKEKQKRSGKTFEKHVSLTVWKDYLTDNHSWIDSVIRKDKNPPTNEENITPAAPRENEATAISSSPVSLAFIKTEKAEEGASDDEWETDGEEVFEEHELAAVLEFDESQREPTTPVKKKMRVPMSMPSI